MTKDEFIAALNKINISHQYVSINEESNDGYCVRKNRLSWEVFTRERGVEFENRGFPSESDALQYLHDELVCIYGYKKDSRS